MILCWHFSFSDELGFGDGSVGFLIGGGERSAEFKALAMCGFWLLVGFFFWFEGLGFFCHCITTLGLTLSFNWKLVPDCSCCQLSSLRSCKANPANLVRI